MAPFLFRLRFGEEWIGFNSACCWWNFVKGSVNLEVPRVSIQRETWCRSKVLAASHLDEFGFFNPREVGLQGQLKEG